MDPAGTGNIKNGLFIQSADFTRFWMNKSGSTYTINPEALYVVFRMPDEFQIKV